MKKFIFGAFVFWSSFFIFAFCFMYSIIHPVSFNGKSGFKISLLCNDLLIPFSLSLIIAIIGLAICWYEAYFEGRKIDMNPNIKNMFKDIQNRL
ncbi:MAG: hypothetical protein E7231_03320 [Cellulosilyticum sp.]|nr:hypothetical protein [Cellulosilyticum sp.]